MGVRKKRRGGGIGTRDEGRGERGEGEDEGEDEGGDEME